MKRTIACMSLLLVLAASPSQLQAQWPNSPLGGGSTAGMTFRPGLRMVTISWLSATPDTSMRYRLLRASDSVANGSDIAGVLATTTFVDKTVTEGTVYFYHVETVRRGDPKPRRSAPQRFMLAKPVALELPAKKKP